MKRALLALALCAPLSGCALVVAGAAGAAGAMYVNGEYDGRLSASPQKCAEATRRVFEDMEIKLLKCDASALDGRVVGKSALEREITVTLKRESEIQTKVSIRVGTFGDEKVAAEIFRKIQARL